MQFDPVPVSASGEAPVRDDKLIAIGGTQFNWDGTVRGYLAALLINVPSKRDSSSEFGVNWIDLTWYGRSYLCPFWGVGKSKNTLPRTGRHKRSPTAPRCQRYRPMPNAIASQIG